ncbi:MAG: TIGR00366 family protein [Phycisphaerales bacterium]
MIATLGLKISEGFRRTAPDPFVLAVLLTGVVLVLALTLTDSTPASLVDTWAGGKGVWSLLAFGMQMCLILVTGHALASTPAVSWVLDRLAGMPRSSWQAVVVVAGVSVTLGVLNWGLGLIAGALIARRVGEGMERRGAGAHYPLIVAAGYTAMLVWHGGFSGSAPLKVTTAKDLAEVFHGESPIGPIPLSETILSPMNLFVTGGLLVIVPMVMALMCPRREGDVKGASEFGVRLRTPPAPSGRSERAPLVPRLLEDTPIVNVALVALIGWWAWRYYLPAHGPSGVLSLSPDSVNLTMLGLGLLLHGTPRRYLAAVEEAARGCAGIILQFPLYAGIMGVMKASGLTEMMADAIAGGAGHGALPVVTLGSAGIVNLFVPSGGGQWAVQGPVAVNAGLAAGVDPGKMVMAVAYGDELTNMLQPFWALPLLAITGVKARDIVGYTAIVMVVAGLWMALGLSIF